MNTSVTQQNIPGPAVISNYFQSLTTPDINDAAKESFFNYEIYTTNTKAPHACYGLFNTDKAIMNVAYKWNFMDQIDPHLLFGERQLNIPTSVVVIPKTVNMEYLSETKTYTMSDALAFGTPQSSIPGYGLQFEQEGPPELANLLTEGAMIKATVMEMIAGHKRQRSLQLYRSLTAPVIRMYSKYSTEQANAELQASGIEILPYPKKDDGTADLEEGISWKSLMVANGQHMQKNGSAKGFQLIPLSGNSSLHMTYTEHAEASTDRNGAASPFMPQFTGYQTYNSETVLEYQREKALGGNPNKLQFATLGTNTIVHNINNYSTIPGSLSPLDVTATLPTSPTDPQEIDRLLFFLTADALQLFVLNGGAIFRHKHEDNSGFVSKITSAAAHGCGITHDSYITALRIKRKVAKYNKIVLFNEALPHLEGERPRYGINVGASNRKAEQEHLKRRLDAASDSGVHDEKLSEVLRQNRELQEMYEIKVQELGALQAEMLHGDTMQTVAGAADKIIDAEVKAAARTEGQAVPKKKPE